MRLVDTRIDQCKLIADLHVASGFRGQHDVGLERRKHGILVNPQHVCGSSILNRGGIH